MASLLLSLTRVGLRVLPTCTEYSQLGIRVDRRGVSNGRQLSTCRMIRGIREALDAARARPLPEGRALVVGPSLCIATPSGTVGHPYITTIDLPEPYTRVSQLVQSREDSVKFMRDKMCPKCLPEILKFMRFDPRRTKCAVCGRPAVTHSMIPQISGTNEPREPYFLIETVGAICDSAQCASTLHANLMRNTRKAGTGARERRARVCNACGKVEPVLAPGVPSALKKCGRCKMVEYCDAECQKRDWPSHKLKCVRPLKVSENLCM